MFMVHIYVYFWTSYTKHQNLELLPNEYMQYQARRKIWGQLGLVPIIFFSKLVCNIFIPFIGDKIVHRKSFVPI